MRQIQIKIHPGRVESSWCAQTTETRSECIRIDQNNRYTRVGAGGICSYRGRSSRGNSDLCLRFCLGRARTRNVLFSSGQVETAIWIYGMLVHPPAYPRTSPGGPAAYLPTRQRSQNTRDTAPLRLMRPAQGSIPAETQWQITVKIGSLVTTTHRSLHSRNTGGPSQWLSPNDGSAIVAFRAMEFLSVPVVSALVLVCWRDHIEPTLLIVYALCDPGLVLAISDVVEHRTDRSVYRKL